MKILYTVIVVSLLSSPLMGWGKKTSEPQLKSKTEKHKTKPVKTQEEPCVVVGIDGLISYFYPQSDRIRDIYGNGWADYALQLSQTFCKKWTVWERADWWQKEGHSRCLHTKTKMRLLSFKLGFDYQYNLKTHWDLYLGAGFDYNLLRIHNYSRYVKQHTQKNEFGFLTHAGVNYHFTKQLYANFNLEYLFQKFHISKHTGHPHVRRNNVDLSGIQVGGGLGVSF